MTGTFSSYIGKCRIYLKARSYQSLITDEYSVQFTLLNEISFYEYSNENGKYVIKSNTEYITIEIRDKTVTIETGTELFGLLKRA